LPHSCEEVKKIVCPLGMDVQRYHACPNDCIIYRGKEYENLDEVSRVPGILVKAGKRAHRGRWEEGDEWYSCKGCMVPSGHSPS
jgi:hypothetical protein